MTEDEILSMPAGREMDRLILMHVFKVENLEWRESTRTEDNRGMYVYSPTGFFGKWKNSNQVYSEGKYSTDITAAWEVVKKGDIHLECGHGEWECWIPGGGVAYAETAPLAICRAALSAVMEK